MSADDAITDQQPESDEGARPSFDAHDFGGDAEPDRTPDHVDPYASREDEAPRTGSVEIPDHVEPYSSRD